jgi:hypothetical protein
LCKPTKEGFHEKKGWVIVVDVGLYEEHKFFSWEEMKRKFGLFVMEEG